MFVLAAGADAARCRQTALSSNWRTHRTQSHLKPICLTPSKIWKLHGFIFALLLIYLFFFSHFLCLFSYFTPFAGYCQNLDELIPTSNHDSPTVVPKFVSRGHLYKAIVGDTIELPCKVQNLGMKWFFLCNANDSALRNEQKAKLIKKASRNRWIVPLHFNV